MIEIEAPEAGAAAGPDARQLFMRGAGHALCGPAYVVGVALMGVGGLARDAGQPIGAAVLSTVLVWAGPAQVIYFAAIAAHAAPLAVAFAILLIGFRFLPMSVGILPLLRRPGTPLGVLLLASHLVSLTVWVESLWRLPKLDAERRQPYFFGFALACIVVSAAATAAGYELIGLLPPALAAGLLFISPAYFSFALMRGAKAALDWTALVLGFALMPLATLLAGDNFDLLAVGLVGGGAAYGVRLLTRGPHERP